MKRLGEFLADLRVPALLAGVLALAVAALSVWWGGLNQDEGWYVYAAQLVHAGKMPYRDFFFTQGPTLPFVYALFAPVWAPSSPLAGLLGARVVTGLWGLAATLFAVALVRRLVPARVRAAASLGVFALLAGNLYHVYFTTIPKTYALGGCFVLAGFWLVACGLAHARAPRALCLAAGGFLLALATGTRISLLLLLPAAGFTLLFSCRRFGWSFLWFGLGGALGLGLTYGFFACDDASRAALLAAQRYHADRGGFDPFFVLGSVSRLARGYAALGAVLFASVLGLARAPSAAGEPADAAAIRRALCWMLGAGFASVFLLQLSAPFPYDDYQVPVMGILTVLIAVLFFTRWCDRPAPAAWFAVLASGLLSFTSPMLQEWATFHQDRFWSQKKEMTELAKLRQVARRVNALDPGGTTLLTQDLYLAVECGRTVPAGLEMGPFSYFPALSAEEARAVHVLNRERLEALLAAADAPLAACSGYAFSIAAPRCDEVAAADQARFRALLARRYETAFEEPRFGQNATTLRVFRRREGGAR